MANLQPAFVKMLFDGLQQPINPNQLHACSNCYRPDLKPEYIAVISNGDVFCRGCAKEIV